MGASALTSKTRRRTSPAKAQPDPQDSDPRGWIGVDFSHFGAQRPSRALLPLLIMGLVVALGIAALPIDLIRTRYALAAATDREKELIAGQHDLIVQKRQLRDPVELAVLARTRGFRPAGTVRTLADPMPSAVAPSPGLPSGSLPHVSAAATDRTTEEAARVESGSPLEVDPR